MPLDLNNSEFDVIVIGAGAAGMMCAMTAGARGRRVLLLDNAHKVGKKILISGGGRCNFTNMHTKAENFISANKHFCKSALAHYTQQDFVDLVNKHQISWHEKALGQLFCDGPAKAIVEMLVQECEDVNVDIRLLHTITDVTLDDGYIVKSDHGTFRAESLVLATGGLSIPKMGATNFTHRIAKKFGLELINVRPGLVPLTLSPDDLSLMQPLSGVSMECVATSRKIKFREAMLLTHRGLSGPAILQVSSYWREGDDIILDILPDMNATEYLLNQKRDGAKSKPKNVLSNLLVARLATALAEAHLPDRPISEISDKELRRLGDMLNRWVLTPAGSEGYAKAEVTLGGVDTAGLSSKTMEAKDVPGLFVIGEAVDVTGWLGGYNFQWAWSSAYVAGEAA